jgi:hypothetical protein
MRKLFVLAASMCLASAAFAHQPEGDLFFAYQFADGNTPVADGDASDWDGVPDSYTLGNDLFFGGGFVEGDREQGSIVPSDMSITHQVGWNETDNRLYTLTTVFDDAHNTDRTGGCFCTDDAIEVEVNMDHSARADQNVDFANGLAYKYAVPPVDGAYAFTRPVAGVADDWLTPGSEWLDFGWSFTGAEFGESTYTYELSISPIESFAFEGNLDSVIPWDLEEDDLFHLNINVADIDVEATYHGFWSTSATSWATDFVLDEMVDGATAVETSTWARIKAQYK